MQTQNNYTNPEWRRVGFPGGSDCKESTCNVGDLGLIPVLGRFPREENGYPVQFLAWRIPMDRGAWQVPYSPWGHKESDAAE